MMVICPKVLFKKKWSSNTILFLFFIEKQNSLYTFRIDFLYMLCVYSDYMVFELILETTRRVYPLH